MSFTSQINVHYHSTYINKCNLSIGIVSLIVPEYISGKWKYDKKLIEWTTTMCLWARSAENIGATEDLLSIWCYSYFSSAHGTLNVNWLYIHWWHIDSTMFIPILNANSGLHSNFKCNQDYICLLPSLNIVSLARYNWSLCHIIIMVVGATQILWMNYIVQYYM